MANPSHPTTLARGGARPSFVVALHLGGVRRGLAGPFPTSEEAEAWAAELIGDDAGWTWHLEPVTAPSALPLAAQRAQATLARRKHLSVVR